MCLLYLTQMYIEERVWYLWKNKGIVRKGQEQKHKTNSQTFIKRHKETQLGKMWTSPMFPIDVHVQTNNTDFTTPIEITQGHPYTAVFIILQLLVISSKQRPHALELSGNGDDQKDWLCICIPSSPPWFQVNPLWPMPTHKHCCRIMSASCHMDYGRRCEICPIHLPNAMNTRGTLQLRNSLCSQDSNFPESC